MKKLNKDVQALFNDLDDVTLDEETVYRYRDLIRVVLAILKEEKLIE